MSPTAWTVLTAPAPDFQEGVPGPSGGIVDFIFGDFALTQPDLMATPITVYVELTAPAPSHTELTVPLTPWSELSG